MPKEQSTPKYRLHSQSGQAVVTLRDSVTGKRRDVLLGEYNSPESRDRYDAVTGEWLANGRRLQGQPQRPRASSTITVSEVVLQYWEWAQTYYSRGERFTIQSTLRALNTIAADDPVEQFGPARLREVRDEMIRRGWSRPTINRNISKVRTVFKWAAGRELLDIAVYQRLTAVEPLRKGKTEAPEPSPIEPVPEDHIEKVKKNVSRRVRALIELQLLTAARRRTGQPASD